MKNIKWAVIIIMLGIAAVLTAEEIPTVKVVYSSNAEPFNWEENGKALGIEPEIAEYCLSKLGIKAVHSFYPWARAQIMVEEGKQDLMITTPTDARFKYGVFGKEKVVISEWEIFTNKENKELIEKAKQFTKIEDLKKYSFIDYFGNGWTASNMRKEDGYKFVVVNKIEQIPEMLSLKRADFSIGDPTIMHWMAKKSNTDEDIVGIKLDIPNTKIHFVFIVSRKSKWVANGLIKGLDKELKAMKKTGELDKIISKYRGSSIDEKGFKSQLKTNHYYTDYDKYPEFKK